MTVKELIELLRNYDEDTPVKVPVGNEKLSVVATQETSDNVLLHLVD